MFKAYTFPVLTTLGLVATISAYASPVACSYNFETSSAKLCCASLEPGVVELFDKRLNLQVGTAYFINDDPKILITADHVLRTDGSEMIGEISGQNPSVNQGKRFDVGVIITSGTKESDVALLRVKDKDFRGPVQPIDISFWIPKLTERLWVIGFPGEDPGENSDEGTLNRIVRKGDSLDLTNEATAEHDVYEVKHSKISAGYSGGPLLTVGGVAIATVHSQKDNRMGYYEPLFRDENLLIKLRDVPGLNLGSALQNVNDMILHGGSEAGIAAAMSSGQIRNFDLTIWYFRLLRDGGAYPNMSALIQCPIMKLFEDRNLGMWADGLRDGFLLPPYNDIYDGPRGRQ
jgi:hypothetical protein